MFNVLEKKLTSLTAPSLTLTTVGILKTQESGAKMPHLFLQVNSCCCCCCCCCCCVVAVVVITAVIAVVAVAVVIVAVVAAVVAVVAVVVVLIACCGFDAMLLSLSSH